MLSAAPPEGIDPHNIDINKLSAVSDETKRAILSTIELDELLNHFCSAIEGLKIFDGYLINILDDDKENLVCKKLRLTHEFRSVENSLLKYKFPVNSDYINALSYRENTVLFFDAKAIENLGENARKLLGHLKIQHLVIIPLSSSESESSLGTILAFRQHNNIDESNFYILLSICKAFYQQIRNARDYNQLQSRQAQIEQIASRQEQFLEFITAVNNFTTTEEIYSAISREFLRQLPFDLASVVMLEDDKLVCKKNTVSDESYRERCNALDNIAQETYYTLDPSDGGTSIAFTGNIHMHFPDVMEIMHLPMSAKDTSILEAMKTPRTFVLMPIRHNGTPIGVVWLISFSQVISITETEIKLIDLLCRFIGKTIKNAELYDLVAQQKREIELLNANLIGQVGELSGIASTDELTGLYNFRAFELKLDRQLSRRQYTQGSELGLVLIDIDRFKLFNDNHGHSAGNAILAGVAKMIHQHAREKDIACRFGGEEFVVILPGAGIDGTEKFAQRVRQAIEESTFETDTGTLGVTVSIGVACHVPNESRKELFERTDQALYSAKNNGRNCIVVTP